MKIDKAGLPFIAGALVPAALLADARRFGWATGFAALAAFFAYFFRDPERRVPSEPGLVVSPADGRVVVAGPADPNAALFKQGAHAVLDGQVDIAYEQSGLWKDTVANQKVTAAITSLGAKNIKGVYSANDGMAGGIATALKGAGINPPLTGQDAELTAIQRILAGFQSSTIYKAYKPEADATAEIAVDLLNGKSFTSVADTTSKSGSGQTVPSKLLPATTVTKANINDTVIKDGLYTVGEVCTADYASACAAAGIK